MPYLPGLKPVLEQLASAPSTIERIYRSHRRQGLENLLELCQRAHVPLEDVPPERLKELCGSHVAHQGVIALLSEANEIPLPQMLAGLHAAPLPLLVALDQVRDPGNVGAIARSAWAMGCAGILLPRHNSASLGPAAFKASAGALCKLPVCTCVNLARALDTCEEQGLTIYGTAIGGSADNALAMDWQLPGVLVLGSEESGIRPGVLKRCQRMVAIPLGRPFNSLNVAQAGAMLLALCASHHTLP